MRLFFSQEIPPFERVLLVESGTRALMDDFLPKLARDTNPNIRVDLVTCYQGQPRGFEELGIYHYDIADYATPASRQQLLQLLRHNKYDLIGIMCTEHPIMTKWKWMLAARVPAKLFIINENLDFFLVDYSNWKVMFEFMLVRVGLYGSSAASTIARALLTPFTLLYLLLYAMVIHLRRKVRAI